LHYSIKKTGQIFREKDPVEKGFENNLYKHIELLNVLKKKKKNLKRIYFF